MPLKHIWEWLDISLFSSFSTATEEQILARSLQNRVDSKFICKVDLLEDIVSQWSEGYAVIRVQGKAKTLYESQYFDTSSHDNLADHMRGRRPRRKVRLRTYQDRNLTYLEVKEKKSNDTTNKSRVLLTPSGENPSKSFVREALSEHGFGELQPSMKISFTRTTLIGIDYDERITIDTNLVFEDGKHLVSLPNLVIFELKQPKFASTTPTMSTLNKCTERLQVSKYITGAQLLWPEGRWHRKKPILRDLQRCIQ